MFFIHRIITWLSRDLASLDVSCVFSTTSRPTSTFSPLCDVVSPFPSSSSSFLLSAPSFPPVLTPLLPGLVLAVGARLVHILLDCLQSRQQFGNLSKKFERGDGLLENRDLLVEDWILLSELHMSLPVVVFYLDGTKNKFETLSHCSFTTFP